MHTGEKQPNSETTTAGLCDLTAEVHTRNCNRPRALTKQGDCDGSISEIKAAEAALNRTGMTGVSQTSTVQTSSVAAQKLIQ